jgi:electron transfer flavoprotein alpha subunit
VIAVVVVRRGELPLGADEAVAEAGGRALLVGEDTVAAAAVLQTSTTDLRAAEMGPFAAGTWATAIAPAVKDEDLVLLPASADGRDLAPRLAHLLGWPLLAGAIEAGPGRVVVARRGGLIAEEHLLAGPMVATLEPGVRGFEPGTPDPPKLIALTSSPDVHDATVDELLPPDPSTMDLSEATRIVAGGAGLAGPEPFDALRAVSTAIGAAWGASRVAADAGWVPQGRFIGTTGVTVDPRLYVALGISGAVQHVSGLGQPDHVIAVNVDPSAPMMAMADLAIVSDAPAVLQELQNRLENDG